MSRLSKNVLFGLVVIGLVMFLTSAYTGYGYEFITEFLNIIVAVAIVLFCLFAIFWFFSLPVVGRRYAEHKEGSSDRTTYTHYPPSCLDDEEVDFRHRGDRR